MRRTLPLLGLGAVVLALVSSVSAAPTTSFAFHGGIPLRLAGHIELEASEAQFLSTSAYPIHLSFDHATLRVADVKTGAVATLPAGSVDIGPRSPDYFLLAFGHGGRVESTAPAGSSRDAWSAANVQLSVLLEPRRLDGSTFEIPAGRYEATATLGTLALSADRILLRGADVAGLGPEFVAATTASPPSTTFELLLDGGKLEASAGAGRALYADDLLCRVNGYAQWAWATGRLDRQGEARVLDDEQVLLHGRLQLRGLGVTLEGAPALEVLGGGSVDLVHVGPLATGLTTPQAAVVASVAGGAALGLAALVYYAPLLPYATAGLVVPLYARLPRDRVLDHHARELIYDRVRAEPGVSAHRLADGIDFGWSTLAYHLRVLERTEKIISVRDGRYRRFFDRESGRFANGRKHVLAVLKNDATLALGRLVLAQPGVTQKEAAHRLGLAASSIHWHVVRLADAGLLEKRRDGHNVRYLPGPAGGEVGAADLPSAVPPPGRPPEATPDAQSSSPHATL